MLYVLASLLASPLEADKLLLLKLGTLEGFGGALGLEVQHENSRGLRELLGKGIQCLRMFVKGGV